MDKFNSIFPNNFEYYNLENLPNEEWKDIKDFEGLYQVSNYGRVKSLSKYKNRKEFILKPYKDKTYRYIVYLYKHSKKKNKYVHRLVGEHFIENTYNKSEINHIIPITKELCDNRVCNLEWVTSKENSQWCVKCGNMFKPTLGKFGKNNHLSKPIVQLELDGSFVNRWENAREIQNIIGIDHRYISRCCTHKCKTAHGYIFMFEEEYYEQMGNIKKQLYK